MLPDEVAALPLELEKLIYEMQDRIMADVVRRLKKTGEITSTADYQLNRYKILGGTTEFVESEIKRLARLSDPEIWEIYDRVVESDYVRNKDLYYQVNGEFERYEDNPELQNWVTASVEQTRGEIENISRSMGFSVDMGGGRTVFTPLSTYYQKNLDAACMDVLTGSFDYSTVIRRTVHQLAKSGIKTVPYASGAVASAPVAVRRAVLTGVNQLSGKINDKVARELNTDLFEVTAHAAARPSHAEWQGRVYTKQELGTVCGLGSVTGLLGANCRHAYYAFIPNVSKRAYTDEYLSDLKEAEAQTIPWQGKEYNKYEQTQKQRQYENVMRKQRAEIKLLKAGGADELDIQAAQGKYMATVAEYKAFSQAMGLKEQMERVYADGLGRMAGGRIQLQTANIIQKQPVIEKADSRLATSLASSSGDYLQKYSKDYFAPTSDTIKKMIDFNILSEKYQNEIAGSLDDLSKRFYSPLNEVKTMDKKESLLNIKTFARTRHNYETASASIVFNPVKFAKLGDDITRLIGSKYIPQIETNDATRYLVTHEFAHSIMNVNEPLPTASRNFLQTDYSAIKKARREINSVFDQYISDVGEKKEALDSYQKKLESNFIFGNIAPTDEEKSELKRLQSEYEKTIVSKYSLTNADEFLAECFTDAEIGLTPSQYSTTVYGIIKKYFGKGL